MKKILASVALATLAMPAFAGAHLGSGDPEAGEKAFNKCQSCHVVRDDDGEVLAGRNGRTGPNLYGVVGRAAGAQDGFRYSSLMEAAAAAGLVWDEENLEAFLKDPSGHLKDVSGESGRSKMSFKLRKKGEDVVAYLKSVGPEMAEEEAEGDS